MSEEQPKTGGVYMGDERRGIPNALDIAAFLAILYTMGYLTMVGLLFFIEIPQANREPLLQLFGLMSAIQMALIAFYFGASKSGEIAQRAVEKRQIQADAVVQELAKNPVVNGVPKDGVV